MATERRNYGITSHTSIHVYADETQVDTANNRSYISTELWILGSSYSAYNVDCNVTGGGGYTNSHLSANGWVKLVSGASGLRTMLMEQVQLQLDHITLLDTEICRTKSLL